jgi:hypothetical protein
VFLYREQTWRMFQARAEPAINVWCTLLPSLQIYIYLRPSLGVLKPEMARQWSILSTYLAKLIIA